MGRSFRRGVGMNEAIFPRGRIFERAASALSGAVAAEAVDDDIRELLGGLGYLHPGAGDRIGSDPDCVVSNRVALLRAAGQFRRIFELNAPDAPGLVFFGAEADPAILDHPPATPSLAGVAGAGLSAQLAFQSCVGEGVEYLSQHETRQDRLERAPLEREMAGCTAATRSFISSLAPYRRTPDGPVRLDKSNAPLRRPRNRGAGRHLPSP